MPTLKAVTSVPVATSRSRTVPSSGPVEASSPPSGENVIAAYRPAAHAACSTPLAVSHS